MIERYFEAYPGVRAYLDDTIVQAKEHGYAETMFGRRRHIPELRSGNAVQRGFGERTAMNHPMQGSAADIIKLAMTEVQRRLMAGGFEAKLLLQVHDELDFSVPEAEIEPVSALVKDVMEHAAVLRVPLDVDISFGDTLGRIPLGDSSAIQDGFRPDVDRGRGSRIGRRWSRTRAVGRVCDETVRNGALRSYMHAGLVP